MIIPTTLYGCLHTQVMAASTSLPWRNLNVNTSALKKSLLFFIRYIGIVTRASSKRVLSIFLPQFKMIIHKLNRTNMRPFKININGFKFQIFSNCNRISFLFYSFTLTKVLSIQIILLLNSFLCSYSFTWKFYYYCFCCLLIKYRLGICCICESLGNLLRIKI